MVTGGSSSGNKGGGFSRIIIIVIILVVLFGGGGSLFKGCLGGSEDPVSTVGTSGNGGILNLFGGNQASGSGLSSVMSGLGLSSMLGGSGMGSYDYSPQGTTSLLNAWGSDQNTGKLDTSVAAGSRKKFTTLKGNNKDTMTIMVYMCGTDLESQYGMASSDLSEMARATLSDKIRLIVYTGGCTRWKTNGISNSVNMILKVENGRVAVLSDNEGSKAMTNPSTLSGFIQFCAKNYKADRNALIFWDHGGGSISGYGYDEKYKSAGSMSLDGIDTALKNGGVKFDFIGFDACLMATAETALTVSKYADYMIASEESEPGVGWYYTNWLTTLGQNSSTSTLEIGKQICDDFVQKCAQDAKGQSTTLSLVDLAEFQNTVPGALNKFATSTTNLVKNDYKTVSAARSGSREFARDNGIDQVDLVHFAKNLGTAEANELVKALTGAIKYNRASADMSNSYGLSIYFPYRSSSYVSKAGTMYNTIGMDAEYTKCIKAFATGTVSGQLSTGGTANQSSSIFNILGGGSNQVSQSTGAGALSDLLGSFLGGGTSSQSSGLSGIASLISGLSGRDLSFLENREVSTEDMAQYISENLLDVNKLNWKEKEDGTLYLPLTKEDWSLINEVALSMYYDDGEGYIDLGMDNIFAFDEGGNLLAPDQTTWMAINGQLVPYYFDRMVADGDTFTILGHIPALLNADLDANGNWVKGTGTLVNLLVLFDNENPKGTILGASVDYSKDDEIEVVAKNIVTLTEGDTLDFVADYYTYEGEYMDTFMVGDRMIYSTNMKISNVEVDEGRADMMYRFTDIYNQQYWSECFVN